MNRRDIVIGAAVLLAIVGIIYWRQSSKEEISEVPAPETLSVEDKLEDKFKYDIPEDVDKAELKDVSGGNASAIATRKFEGEKYSSTILADLEDPASGAFYQGWLMKGEEGKEGYSVISLGKFTIAKGGWMLDYSSKNDYSDFDRVVVTLEKVFDNTPEKKILEGRF